ncbi:hypothetical protein NTGM5_130086 [Candidatus Nitrotoga sp. M5]|uniref:DUF4238 domain-containing protein n=1 Tax=Candidatus Nitrotoga sp. M5 TaxID=2890409 RepID=UPI001EF31D6C|nr:DUF4238 domain-containing protein [Candidatus Nitrotoga sp. M5]CAH1385554.1 hypothetical protein NTGM5_130086 [Candidatus Nitrotoga sp. M5]
MKPYVWVFDRDGANPRRKAPVNLFTETDIYTIKCADGERDLRLEHGFSELEDKFTRIRNSKFKRHEWPDAEQIVCLLAFVATAQARTAAFRDHHRQQWSGTRKRMEEMQAAYKSASPAKKATMELMGSPNSESSKVITLDDVRVLEKYPIQQMIGMILQSVYLFSSACMLRCFALLIRLALSHPTILAHGLIRRATNCRQFTEAPDLAPAQSKSHFPSRLASA